MSSKVIELWVSGNPVAQGRPRFARMGAGVRTYDPKKSADWKQFIRLRAAVDGVTPFPQGVALEVKISFQIARPVSVPVKKRQYPVCTPDLDNLAKGSMDALKGIAWHDDSQVIRLTAAKSYGETPGVRIEVREVS